MKQIDVTEEKGALFTKHDLNKLIRPLIIEQLLAISMGMFDTMMISSLGDNAVSGVSLVDMLNIVMINFFSALGTGGAVLCSHALGLARVSDDQVEYRKARSFAKQLLIVLLAVSICIAVLCYILRAQLLTLIFGNEQQAVIDHALVYFAVSTVSYPFIAIYNGCAALFRTMGNSRVTMIISAVVNAANICGNALFIYVFKWGVAGAAWSTTVSRAVGMVVLLILIMNKSRPIYIDFCEKFTLETGTIKRILRIGVPSGFENSIFNLGRILTISMMTSFGAEQLAANAVANNIDSLSVVPGAAVGLAMVTVVGQCIGAGDFEAAHRYEKKLLKKSYIYLAIMSTGLLLALPLILRLYSASDEALRIASILIWIHLGVGMLLWPLSFTTPNALRAAKDVKFTLIVAIFSMVTFRIVLSYIIGVRLGMGIIGVWMAMLVDWVFRAIMFNTRIHTGKWLKFVKRSE